MSHSDVVDKIITQLRFQDEHGGFFHQKPYKDDFLNLFVEAAREGEGLRGDRLLNIVAERAPDLLDGKTWPLLYAAWGEWDYAWAHWKRGSELDDGLPGG